MTEHTPTPWHSEEVRTSVGRCFKIGSPEMTKTDGKPSYVCVYDDWGYGDNVQSANAAFIVKAVNSHDALVKALEQIADGTRDEAPPFRAFGREQMVDIARKALASIKEPT